jgi:sugar/nucleoside kinase (ribokinase family)
MTKTPKVDLVGVGLNATDTLIQIERFPAPGSKVEYSSQEILPGGQAATTVIACALWGLKTRYVGKLGDDAAAELHKRAFADAHVDARLIQVEGAASPQSLILVDGEGERTVLCRRNERLTMDPHELEREWITSARLLHTDGRDTEAATRAAQWAHEAGIPVVADLDEIYPEIDNLLAVIDYVIVSRDFPTRYTGQTNLTSALKEMHTRFDAKLVAATLGAEGVLAWDGEELLHVPAYRVPARDTTGAGDVFHAGFIYGLLQGWPLKRELEFACAAAALNCLSLGARGIRSVAEIEELMSNGVRHTAGRWS